MSNKSMEVTERPTWASIANTKCSGGGGSGSTLKSGATLEIWSGSALIIRVSFDHIVKCVNEYEALCKVAEALKALSECSKCQNGCAADDMSCASNGAKSALATLAALREGETV